MSASPKQAHDASRQRRFLIVSLAPSGSGFGGRVTLADVKRHLGMPEESTKTLYSCSGVESQEKDRTRSAQPAVQVRARLDYAVLWEVLDRFCCRKLNFTAIATRSSSSRASVGAGVEQLRKNNCQKHGGNP